MSNENELSRIETTSHLAFWIFFSKFGIFHGKICINPKNNFDICDCQTFGCWNITPLLHRKNIRNFGPFPNVFPRFIQNLGVQTVSRKSNYLFIYSKFTIRSHVQWHFIDFSIFFIISFVWITFSFTRPVPFFEIHFNEMSFYDAFFRL